MRNNSCTDILKELQSGSGLKPHYRFHPRVWEHTVDVIDLGCGKWDWSQCFLNNKRVIGCDPTENYYATPIGAKFYKGFVGSFCGKILYQKQVDTDFTSAKKLGEDTSSIISLERLVQIFDIQSISLLKMNIEGMEYDLLIHFTAPVADQIVVSFHDFPEAPYNNKRATEAIILYLSQWYDWCCSDERYSWYVFLKR